MRTKIKEIIVTGGKFGMRGDFLLPSRGVLFIWLLFILNSLVVDYCTNISMNR